MASIGINFRSTSGFVTDGAGQTYCIGDAYPTTRGGLTFGWNTGTLQTRDRSTAPDPRLAGINFIGSNDAIFRLDLATSGSKNVRLAMGDDGSAQANQYIQVIDSNGVTPLFTINDLTGTTNGHFDDAVGADYDEPTWPGSNSPASVTLSGALIYFQLGTPAQAGLSTLAHFYVEDAGGATGKPHHYLYQQQAA